MPPVKTYDRTSRQLVFDPRKVRYEKDRLVGGPEMVGRAQKDDRRSSELAQGKHRGEIRVGGDEDSVFLSRDPHDVWVRRAQEANVNDVDRVMARAAQASGNLRRQVGVE